MQVSAAVSHHSEPAPQIQRVGGAKQSGIGVENGIEGLHGYTQRKIINVAKA